MTVVRVTRQHIASGERFSEYGSPLLEAIRESGPFASVRSLGYGAVQIDGRKVQLPREAIAFELSFDLGRRVRPIEFQLG